MCNFYINYSRAWHLISWHVCLISHMNVTEAAVSGDVDINRVIKTRTLFSTLL